MGFLAPWFLAGLAALSVPIFVHLLRKHVTIPRPVRSLMFFERVERRARRAITDCGIYSSSLFAVPCCSLWFLHSPTLLCDVPRQMQTDGCC